MKWSAVAARSKEEEEERHRGCYNHSDFSSVEMLCAKWSIFS